MCRLAVAAGAHDGDVAQIAFGYGMFTGGFGLHYGLQRAGVAVLPISAGNTARQIQYMKDFGTTILIATPSYALYIGEVLQRRDVPLEQLRLRLGMFGAEHCSEEMRAQIESRLPIRATDNYGLTELTGPGVAGECECRSGMHISEDHFLAECLDPATGKPVADGEVGELVVTAFTRECSPVLRYRTRDLTSLTRERCACGRTTARMGKVVGRTDDMFIISGVNIFPSAIESVLFQIEGVEPFYQIVLGRSERARHVRGARGGHGHALRRLDGRPARVRAPGDRGAPLGAPRPAQGQAGRAGQARAQRGQGPARHRQPAELSRPAPRAAVGGVAGDRRT